MDIKDIQNLVRFVAKAGVSEVKYKNKDFEIYIKTPLGGEPVSYVTPQVAYQSPVSAPAVNPISATTTTSEAATTADDSKYITIKSPMIGTFYTGHKGLKSSHKYFALSSILCMTMAIYTGHKMISGNRKKKVNKEKVTEREE